MEHFHGSYSLPLVLLSFIIATFASYTALDLAERIRNGSGVKRFLWLIGAITMGIGIWSMHFIGMLAYTFSVPVYYHVGTVLLSVILAVGASAIALSVVGLRGEKHSFVLFAGGVCMAAAISGMHYVGMAAISLDVTYDLGVVAHINCHSRAGIVRSSVASPIDRWDKPILSTHQAWLWDCHGYRNYRYALHRNGSCFVSIRRGNRLGVH